MTIQELEKLLLEYERENLEFKNKSSFSDDELFDYCAALANEGGGYLIFGIGNKNRIVVGTKIFQGTLQGYPGRILNAIDVKVKVEELFHPKGRVVIFQIPSRPKGRPIQSKGKYRYPMRVGESLTEMDQETLRVIFIEVDDDFSSKIVPSFLFSDLDENALERLRELLQLRNHIYSQKTYEDILKALELLNDDGLNYGALILLGKKEKIDQLLPGAEIVFEWRQDPNKISHDFRKEWREPFLKIFDDVWKTISDRNIRIPLQEGLIQREVLAFNEQAIREAILNAITHRDYTIVSQSVFIKADPSNLLILSPGGFLPGITPENVLERQAWRNRRIAEVFQKLGLVERSGQGMDQIFESTIRDGKGLPDLSGSDSSQVFLKIPARVKDKNFILFLEKIGREKQTTFSFEEIYQLELLREKKILSDLKFKERFLELGVVEKVGRTSGIKYILSHRYYQYEERPGLYTRIRGLSREHKKELILEHIRREGKGRREDFLDAFPDLKPNDISNFLQELKGDGKIEREGSDRAGYWKLVDDSN